MSDKDLTLVDNSAYISSKWGQEGIFYPEAEMRALQQHLRDVSVVEPDMIPEVMIKRQVPKRKLHLEQLRLLAVRGKRPGQKGRETFFYKKEDVEKCLKLKLISEHDREGTDFITFDKVSPILQLELPTPKLGMKVFCPVYSQAQLCYFPPEVETIRRSSLMNNVQFPGTSSNSPIDQFPATSSNSQIDQFQE